MATKKKPVTLTYKIGARYVLTKAPKSLSFLKDTTFTVNKANSSDITFGGRGLLVVSRAEIKKKTFGFTAEPVLEPKPASQVHVVLIDDKLPGKVVHKTYRGKQ